MYLILITYYYKKTTQLRVGLAHEGFCTIIYKHVVNTAYLYI